MAKNSFLWFRMYSDFLDDPKMVSLAFEDQRHYIGLLALKSEGTLDQDCDERILDRIVAQRLWISHALIDEVKNRLINAKLIDEFWQPLAWCKRQQVSDSSTERVKKHRVKKMQECNGDETLHETQCNNDETLHDRFCNGLDKIRREEIREEKIRQEKITSAELNSSPLPDDENDFVENPFVELPLNKSGEYHAVTEQDVNELSGLYPAVDVRQQLRAMLGWLNANPARRKTRQGIKNFINTWMCKQQDRGIVQPLHTGRPGLNSASAEAPLYVPPEMRSGGAPVIDSTARRL